MRTSVSVCPYPYNPYNFSYGYDVHIRIRKKNSYLYTKIIRIRIRIIRMIFHTDITSVSVSVKNIFIRTTLPRRSKVRFLCVMCRFKPKSVLDHIYPEFFYLSDTVYRIKKVLNLKKIAPQTWFPEISGNQIGRIRKFPFFPEIWKPW